MDQQPKVKQVQTLQNAQFQKDDELNKIRKIGNFVLDTSKILGKGSFSTVYRGYDASNGNFELKQEKFEVAIKVIEKNILSPQLKHLIDSQIKILRLINHANIVKCYQIHQDNNSIYIVLQLCLQGDLQTKIDTTGPFQQNEALPIIKGVFNGLLYLNSIDIIHRDIKVANIFMQNKVPKIADFGFAMYNKSKKQFQDISIGSPIYMSPEGIKHNVYGPKTDVWAFGIFVYELLHGKTPYSHCTKERQLKYNISNPINWNSLKTNLSYSIKQVIFKCLEVNYEKRITFDMLKQLDFFKDAQKTQSKQLIELSRLNVSLGNNTLQITPTFHKNQTPDRQKPYTDYCQDLEQQISRKIHSMKIDVDLQDRLKKRKKATQYLAKKNGKFESQNFLQRLNFVNKNKKNKSKSKQTPRTREDVISLDNKNFILLASQRSKQKQTQRQIERRYTTKVNINPSTIQYPYKKASNPLKSLKTEPNGCQMLLKYKKKYGQQEDFDNCMVHQNRKAKRPFRTQVTESGDYTSPTCNMMNVLKSDRRNNDIEEFSFFDNSHKTSPLCIQNNTDRLRCINDYKLQKSKNHPIINHTTFTHTNPQQNHISYSKQYQTSHQKRENLWKSNDYDAMKRTFKSNGAKGIFNFSRQNLNSYLYLIHFGRLIYKLCCNLQQKAYLWEIKASLAQLCVDVHEAIVQKIYTKSRNNSSEYDNTGDLMQIGQTAQKYLHKYKSQFQIISPGFAVSLSQTNIKLQNELNQILSSQLKSNSSLKAIKLLYYGWVYLFHYQRIYDKYFIRDNSKYWLQYNAKTLVKQIEGDIDKANSIASLQQCLKLKKNLTQRQM